MLTRIYVIKREQMVILGKDGQWTKAFNGH